MPEKEVEDGHQILQIIRWSVSDSTGQISLLL
jgi:hypothetical protein